MPEHNRIAQFVVEPEGEFSPDWTTCEYPASEPGSRPIPAVKDKVILEATRHFLSAWQATFPVRAPFDVLAKELAFLRSRVAAIEDKPFLVVPIESFAPEPYELVRPFSVVIRQVEGAFLASFFDANISAAGDNDLEAFANLKSMIVEALGMLDGIGEKNLGPEPLRQLQILREFIRKKG